MSISQPFFVAAQHLDYLLHRLQAASHRVVRPGFEEALGGALVAVAPELAEVLLDAPGPARLQVELVQCPKRDGFSASAIGILSQPGPFAAHQWRSARLRELAMLLLSAWFKNGGFRVTQARQYLPQEFGISGSVRWNGGRPVDLHRVSFAVAAADQSPASSASAGAPHPSRSGGDFCPPVQRLCCAGTCGDSGRIAASSGTHRRVGDAA